MKNSDTPANPTTYMDQTNGCGELYSDNAGLTKREAFAMAAMQGILSHSFGRGNPEGCAIAALQNADALLKQLEVK